DPIGELCAPIGPMPSERSARSYMQWLRMAAVAGNPRAMVEYAANLVPRFGVLDGADRTESLSPLAYAEEIAVYRQQAIDYLGQAQAMGEPEALLELARQYDDGSLYPPDALHAYAYVLAYMSTATAQT